MSAELHARLAAPFALSDIAFKPQVLTKDRNKGMAATYVDARAVAARLDDVFGFGWSAAYTVIQNDERLFVAECTLTVRVDGLTVSRADVGESGNSDHEASRHKSAYSDALKRAAVQFGIGRYLYDLPKLWAEYDDAKKRWSDAGLQKLERDYQAAVARLTPAASAPARTSPLPPPSPITPPAQSREPLMGDQGRRELFQALTAAGLAYGTDTEKRKARGFVWFLNYQTVEGLPDSMKQLTAREADTALHRLRADAPGSVRAFAEYVSSLRSHAA